MKIIQSVVAGLSPHAKAIIAGIYAAPGAGAKDMRGFVGEFGALPFAFTNDESQPYIAQIPHGLESVKKEYKKQLDNLKEKNTLYASKELCEDSVFEFRKVTLMAEMLLRNGLRDEGIELLKRLISISEELELFSERAHIYTLADTFNLRLGAIQASKKYRNEIAEEQHIFQQSLNLAAVFTNGIYINLIGLELKKHERGIELLKQNYEQSGLTRIGYFYHYSSLCYAMATDNFKGAVFHGELLTVLIQKNPRIFSTAQNREVSCLLSAAYIGRNNSKKALTKAYEAVKLSAKHSVGHAQSLETLFCALFQAKQFSALPEIVAKVKRNACLKSDRLSTARWRLRQAYMYFHKGDYTEALRQLKDCCCMPREEAEWVIYSQLLESMCRIELGQYEWFQIRAEALRKCIYRYENKNRHKRNGRLVMIYRLLKQLHQNGLDYGLLEEEENDALELLASSEGNFFCNPMGPELFRFEEWIQLKARKQGLNRRGKRLVT